MKSSLVSEFGGHVTCAHIAGIPVGRERTPAVFISAEASEPATLGKAPNRSSRELHLRSSSFSTHSENRSFTALKSIFLWAASLTTPLMGRSPTE